MSTIKPKIWLSSPHMGGNELHYIQNAFDTNWIAPLGPHVDAFEKSISEYCGMAHCAALNSGTSAIHLALILLSVGPGDYVICQSFTFAASANPVAYLGATPVFIDSENDTWNMDPALLEKAIVDIREGCPNIGTPGYIGRKTKVLSDEGMKIRAEKSPGIRHPANCNNIKAIIPVHLYGMPAKMDKILAVAEKYNIPVIEDAAEALGSRYKCSMAGSMGLMSVLSFNGNKIITTSGGGALLSDDKELIERARFLSTQARDPAPHYQHTSIGYNYRMSNVVAGIGRGQLEVLNERVTKRKENNRFYRDNLGNIVGIDFQTEPSSDFFSNYWLTAITVNPDLTEGVTREDIRHAMTEENIEARPLWKPLHIQPIFENKPAYTNGVSEILFDRGLCLPSGSNLTDVELNRVLDTLMKALRLTSAKKAVAKSHVTG